MRRVLRTPFLSLLLVSLIVLMIFVSPSAQGQTFSVIRSFNNTPDGAGPYAGLTMDRAGDFYGTTSSGGAHGMGLVFELSHRGSGWVMSPLYSFSGGSDGSQPVAGITIGPDGNLYGTTLGTGAGTVFKLSPPVAVCTNVICPWFETTLHRFNGTDGMYPNSVAFDRAGNLYGTTSGGGSSHLGVVYELKPSGSGWVETVLHSFTGPPDGDTPNSGVVFDLAGSLYGTTGFGGVPPSNCGTVYRVTPAGSGWSENILYNFQGQSDGCTPGALTLDPSGNLYGTTSSDNPSPTVFKLTASGGHWTYSLIYNFGQPGGPTGALALDASGNLYGTTGWGSGGGCIMGQGCGNVFKLTFSGGGWSYASLHDFNENDGGNPDGGVILDPAGNIYGTTWDGGSSQNCNAGDYSGCGVIFEIKP